jgi:hypothetical protein
MTPVQKNRLFILFTGHAAETLTAEEHRELQDTLLSDAEARRLWFVHQDVEAGVRASHGETHALAGVRESRQVRWLSARPLTAAAAGLLIGLFSATLVFGLVTESRFSVLTLLKEGFEDATMKPLQGIPEVLEVWSGDLRAPSEKGGDVKPVEGMRMVALPPIERQKLSYAFRFIDAAALPFLLPGQTRQIEVTARFHTGVPGTHGRFQIRLAAFAEEAYSAHEIWARDTVDEEALLHVAKTVEMQPSERGWTMLRSVIDVPEETTVVLISLAAGVSENDPEKTVHYLDDVQARLITRNASMH